MGGATAPPRAALLPLLADLNELKRMRPAPSGRSLAEQSFLRAWGSIAAGADPTAVARRELRLALVGTQLAGADEALLAAAGLQQDEAAAVCRGALQTAAERAGPWSWALLEAVATSASDDVASAPPPPFASLLALQPRAPATRAGVTRVSVEPPENHADHCASVAVAGVVMAVVEDADPGVVVLAALAHHLHNARLPDGGFAGEEALGAHLPVVVDGLRRLALAELPSDVADAVERAAVATLDASTPEGRAFHAADVADRVLQAGHHARAASFTLEQALDDHGLVHEGPLQCFQHEVLGDLGLLGSRA